MNNLTFNNTALPVISQNNQPWLTSASLAQALEYKDAKSIQRIFTRNSDEFTNSMTGVVKLTTPSGKQETRIFSLRGCHLIAMFSRTKVAKEFRKWVLDVLDKEVEQQENSTKQIEPPQTLTPAQQRHIQERVSEIVNSDKFGFTYQSLYSKLKTRFKVGTYKDIPQFRYPEVCKCLGCKPKGEPVKIPTLPQITKDGRYLVIVENGITNRVKNIDTYNLVNADYIHALQVNLRLIAKQTRLLSGEASPSILDTPLLGADL